MNSFVKQSLVLFLLFVGLVSNSRAQVAPACELASVSIQACANILRSNQLNGPPPPACCSGLRVIAGLEALLGPVTTSACVQLGLRASAGATTPTAITNRRLLTTVDVSTQIQAACGVNLGFNISATA